MASERVFDVNRNQATVVSMGGGAGKKKAKKAQRSTALFVLSQLSLGFTITTLLLMLLMCHSQDGDTTGSGAGAAGEDSAAEAEVVREARLRLMQKTMFVNNKRPPDSKYNINVTLSDMIPLDRAIEDTRLPECKTIEYDESRLPTVSVITVSYNEALSMLLRTVHSVLQRTPPRLLADVIIVNDHSTNPDLHGLLDKYVSLLPGDKVKVIQNDHRMGLMKARMKGAAIARGEVIMFQDAHTEANVGWAEPMLEEIRKNPKAILQPEVEVIDAWSLEYYKSWGTVPRGGWTWDLRYVWMELPDHEKRRRLMEGKRRNVSSVALPFRAAAMVGCALMVRKDYFNEIGAFDPGMNVWGGENIELAMRNWLCGGTVLTHPCSRVAHTFKPFSYSFDGDHDKIVEKNLLRIAALWMDDWAKFFYASTWNWPTKRTTFTKEELESLEERRKLKKKLNCKPFAWYMENIYPDVATPPIDSSYYGEVTNLKTERCWAKASDGYISLTTFCYFHRFIPQNVFWIDQQHNMHFGNQCVYVTRPYDLLQLGSCDHNPENNRWWVAATAEVEGKIHVNITRNNQMYELCATQVTNVVKVHYMEQMMQATRCASDHNYQSWRFHYRFDWSHRFGPFTL